MESKTLNNDLQNLFLKHCHRKCRENMERGYYRRQDVIIFLHNSGIKKHFTKDDISCLQHRFYELNMFLNKLRNCENTEEGIIKLCQQELNITPDEQTVKKLVSTKTELEEVGNMLEDWIKDKYPEQTGGFTWIFSHPDAPLRTQILDFIQFLIDLVGFIPVYGIIADITNGVIYLLRWMLLEAGLAFLTAIPLSDVLTKPLKWIVQLLKARRAMKASRRARRASQMRRSQFVRQQPRPRAQSSPARVERVPQQQPTVIQTQELPPQHTWQKAKPRSPEAPTKIAA